MTDYPTESRRTRPCLGCEGRGLVEIASCGCVYHAEEDAACPHDTLCPACLGTGTVEEGWLVGKATA